MIKESRQKTCFNCEARHNCNFVLNKYGYCCYCFPNENALIFNLYIHKEFRRLGHGTAIIKRCITEIRACGYEKEIKIEAAPTENSISIEVLAAFYKRMGLTLI